MPCGSPLREVCARTPSEVREMRYETFAGERQRRRAVLQVSPVSVVEPLL